MTTRHACLRRERHLRHLQYAVWSAVAILAAMGTGCAGSSIESALLALTSDGVIREPLPPGAEQSPPEVFRESYTTFVDQQLIVGADVGVLANDRGVEKLYELRGVTERGGFVELSADGGFTYSPPAGYLGADYFNYQVENAFGASQGRVTLKIVPPDAVPVP